MLAWNKPFAAVALSIAASCSQVGAAAPQAAHTEPVVVELFQSQGCSSCPPANANVNALSARTDLLTLSYGVTYWDRLGWTDTFARPEFTQRQRDYARGLGNGNVYTPQVVLNGRADLVGSNRAELDAAIARAAKTTFAAQVALAPDSVTVTAKSPTRGPADVWLVQYDPRALNVPIRAGENNGRTLPHVHVVRSVRRLGAWTGTERTYPLPTPTAPLRTAVLVQMPNGGPIVGAATGR